MSELFERALAIIAYLSIIGWVLAYAIGKDSNLVNSHLKYAVIVILLQLLANILLITRLFFIAELIFIISFVLTLLGIIYAAMGNEEVPVLSQVYESYLSQYLDQFF